MSSLTMTAPAQMFEPEDYPSLNALDFEAIWCWNHALHLTQEAERAEPDQVKIARNVLELHAVEGWRLRALRPLIRGRAFVNERPGGRPGKDERAQIEAMTPAEALKSLFSKGVVFTSLPDDLVWGVVLEYAKTHYGAGNFQAARRLTEATIQCLAVRAGIEPANSAELMVNG